MIERIPRFGIRTLFLATTLAALVVYAFTLGSPEGWFAIFFFGCVCASKTKKEKVGVTLILIFSLIGFGIFARHNVRQDQSFAYFKEARISIFFSGNNQKQLEEVLLLLDAEMPNNMGSSSSAIIPFFRSGIIQLSQNEEDLETLEAEVRRLIEESFPDLSVEIESHSALDGTE